MRISVVRKLGRTGLIYISLVIVLCVLLAASGILIPDTLKATHLLEIARQSVPLGITSLGQTLVILSGGIDLSVGEMMTLANIVGADLMRGKDEMALKAILVVSLLGLVLGGINGWVIAQTDVPPLVMTFGMGSIVKGAYLLYCGGAPKGSVSPILRTLGSGRLGIVPISPLLFLGLFGVLLFFSKRTTWGRSTFYIGNNSKAAYYAGIPTKWRLVLIYAFSGLMAVFSGLILSGYIGIANFSVGGDAYNMNSVAAGVVGGNTFNGQGGLGGAVLGSLIITLLTSLMTSLGIGQAGKSVMQGVVITLMVALYTSQTDLVGKLKRFYKERGRRHVPQ